MNTKHLLALLFLMIFQHLSAQKTPRFQKTNISTSGCTAYMPAEPGSFDKSISPDSSIVYTGLSKFDGFDFGVITIKLNIPITSGTKDIEELLIAYMDYLKKEFKVANSVGYGKGHQLESEPKATGIIDYWKTEKGDEITVKAWGNGEYIGFLYIQGATEYPNSNVVHLYLDGFRFPKK